jgi:hypothetical protein
MQKLAGRVRFFLLAAATILVFSFAATDAAAQDTTNCKACGITCTPSYCTSSCNRVSYTDCRTWPSLYCAGLCYHYWDYTYGSFQCRTDPNWYPCYA